MSKVEVTPEMIEAGCRAMLVVGETSSDEIVRAVYKAMRALEPLPTLQAFQGANVSALPSKRRRW